MATARGLIRSWAELPPARRQGVALRAGIHTGPGVVVEDHDTARRRPILGHTLDLAIALESRAEPAAVWVSGATRGLIADRYELAAQPLEASPEASTEAAYRVVADRASPAWAAPLEEAPLVGRETELCYLRERLALALAGQGQAVLLAGSAGIGKTRLLRALRAEGPPDLVWLWVSGAIDQRHRPFHLAEPLRSQLRGMSTALRSLRGGSPEAVETLASGTSGSPTLGSRTASRGPELQEALLAQLQEVSRRRPVVLAVEDLQWLDATSLTWVDAVSHRLHTAPIFLLLTCRPGFHPPWAQGSGITRLSLPRLTSSQVESLLRHLLTEPTAPGLRPEIAQLSDGIPGYLVELARDAAGPRRGGPDREAKIPLRLWDMVTERLDRLGPARDVARRAAALDPEVTTGQLAQVVEATDDLGQDLQQLLAARILEALGPERYRFRQKLVREVLRQSLLPEDRTRWQRLVSETGD